MVHNALATLQVLTTVVISLKAVDVLPTDSQSTRADQIVSPPAVNCAWPQFLFESLGLTSGASGSAKSSWLSSAMMLLDGLRASILVTLCNAWRRSAVLRILGKLLVMVSVQELADFESVEQNYCTY